MKSQMQSAEHRFLSSSAPSALWKLCSITKFLSKTALRRGFFTLLLIAIAAGVCTPSATATPTCPGALLLPPGGTVVMGAGAFGDCTGAAPGTLLASLVAPFTTTSGFDSGTLVSAVYREGAGTLDFYYQIDLNSTSTNCGHAGQPICDSIARETDINFSNGGPVVTYVATRADPVGPPFLFGTVFPITADRSASGNLVGFSFNPPVGAEIPPGFNSGILIISTDAINFTAGTASVHNGTGADVASFEPVAPATTPEPTSILLFGTGLLGLARAMRRKVA